MPKKNPEIGRTLPDDPLIPDPVCRRELGISSMTMWRLEFGQPEKNKPPHPNFPDRYTINGRNFRKQSQWEAFKESLRVKEDA
jgi:hypothetical protein